MATAMRTFVDSEAVRQRVPLMIGLVGPSGGGKTYSALRLASGIQRVTGGDIYVVDTEAKRALHYADRFKFRHVPFQAPFGPLDYLAAVEHCQERGAKVVIVDSMSHEHEGPGGVLEMHSRELDRMAGDDWKKRERVNMLAWQRPKADRRRMINSILQLPVSAIFCFRAKEKIKIVKGEEPKQLGYMPIAGEEFVFEMTVNCLLLPRADGVPTWQSAEVGERATMKLPEQFKGIFSRQGPLSEDIGEQLARWAEGGDSAGTKAKLVEEIRATKTAEELEALIPKLTAARPQLARVHVDELAAAVKQRKAELADVPAATRTFTDAPAEPPPSSEPRQREPGEDE